STPIYPHPTVLQLKMPIPPPILTAIADAAGGHVLLVVGAGCSFEPPTSIPMAPQCARDAHAALLNDGVLLAGECADPSDLSSVADAVWAKTGGQAALVDRLPLA